MPDRWIQRWSVPSSSKPGTEYTVAVDKDNNFGCSCPAWTNNRRECKHIKQIKAQLAAQSKPKPMTATPPAKPVKVLQPVQTASIPSKPKLIGKQQPASIASFLELDE